MGERIRGGSRVIEVHLVVTGESTSRRGVTGQFPRPGPPSKNRLDGEGQKSGASADHRPRGRDPRCAGVGRVTGVRIADLYTKTRER